MYEEAENCNLNNGTESCYNEVRTFSVGGKNAREDLQKCVMEDCGEACDGCEIHFYHNSIDRDEIFDPTQSNAMVGRMIIKLTFV